MDRVQDVVTRVAGRPMAPAAPDLSTLSADARNAVEELINRLFREIRTARPAWRQAWPSTEVLEASKKTWITAFLEAGITDWDSQIAFGLQALRGEPSDFVPAPGKFVTWCQPTPQALGLPSLEEAYAEALQKTHPSMAGVARWSCPAVYHAAARAGFSTLQQLGRSDGLALLEQKYVLIRRALARGEQLPVVPVAALPSKPNSNPEVGNDALAAIRNRIGGRRG